MKLWLWWFYSPQLENLGKALITGGVELIDVLQLEPVQRDGLVQNRESASLLQQLIQLQVLLQPQRVLLRISGPLHRQREVRAWISEFWWEREDDAPFCSSLSWWSAGIRQTGTDKHRSALCSLVTNQNKESEVLFKPKALGGNKAPAVSPVSTSFPSCSRLRLERRFSRVTAFSRCFRFWTGEKAISHFQLTEEPSHICDRDSPTENKCLQVNKVVRPLGWRISFPSPTQAATPTHPSAVSPSCSYPAISPFPPSHLETPDSREKIQISVTLWLFNNNVPKEQDLLKKSNCKHSSLTVCDNLLPEFNTTFWCMSSKI